jgi:dTDP-4-dehydrorhamnose 3,5-epimerase
MESLSREPKLLDGGSASDARGRVSFVNPFTFAGVKRFYMIENNPGVIRAFHGHMKEAKYVFVCAGKARIVIVPIDGTATPDKNAKPLVFNLSIEKSQILYIPGGYANGSMSLEPGTRIQYFSTATVEDSKADDYRYEANYWGADLWK